MIASMRRLLRRSMQRGRGVLRSGAKMRKMQVVWGGEAV